MPCGIVKIFLKIKKKIAVDGLKGLWDKVLSGDH